MIPTVVIVNDDNAYLNELASQLKTQLRVVRRSSLEGEKLYGAAFFEGVLYFDEHGAKQLTRRDNYGDIAVAIQDKLKNLNTNNRLALDNYLSLKNDKKQF
jgi:hypothetical protein